MSDILRWFSWTPSEYSNGTKWPTKPSKPTQPPHDSGSVSFVGTSSSESQKIGVSVTSRLPWPGYNGGKQFVCEKCGTRFDTSAGFAKHSVYSCVSGKEIRP